MLLLIVRRSRARAPDVGSCDAAAQQNSHRRAGQGAKAAASGEQGQGRSEEVARLPVERNAVLRVSCSGANRRDRLVICGVSVRNGRHWRGTSGDRDMEHTEPLAICNAYVLSFTTYNRPLCQLHLGCFFARTTCCYDVMWVRHYCAH
jgi:hypothetical protein